MRLHRCPRPCGRGGFKPHTQSARSFLHIVPAHAGGVDLSIVGQKQSKTYRVPAHAGGVDLSIQVAELVDPDQVPAHAGGVDLSTIILDDDTQIKSPPMRAGWI